MARIVGPSPGGLNPVAICTCTVRCTAHRPARVQLLQAVDAWRVAQASDAFTGEPALAPSRLEALRWVHSDSALVEGRLVGASAVQLGGCLPAPRGVRVPPGGSEGAARPPGPNTGSSPLPWAQSGAMAAYLLKKKIHPSGVVLWGYLAPCCI
jgi:hypothetical protein